MEEGTRERGLPVLRARLVVELRDDVESYSYPATAEQIDRAVERFVEMGTQINLQWAEVVCGGVEAGDMLGPLFRPDDDNVFCGVIPYDTYVERVDATLCRY